MASVIAYVIGMSSKKRDEFYDFLKLLVLALQLMVTGVTTLPQKENIPGLHRPGMFRLRKRICLGMIRGDVPEVGLGVMEMLVLNGVIHWLAVKSNVLQTILDDAWSRLFT